MSDATKAVFLSYASQDADAAREICATLRAAGIEVWFDQSELRGGDSWDAKIRKQIRECALFVPVISANTQQRLEGYFRLEWKLAEDRSHLIAKSKAFIVPVVVDETSEREAHVPDVFLGVQWVRLRDGAAVPAFVAQVRRLLDSPRGAQDAATGVATAARDSHAHASGRVTRKFPFSVRWAAVAAFAVAASISAWKFWPAVGGSKKPANASTAPTPATDDKAVAVLPFANLSGDPAQEYFSDGLTDELLNALARERDLRVPGRASIFSFKGTKVGPAEIARALNVTRLVEGSVQRVGNHVRISVALTRAADGFTESLGSFDKELIDAAAMFALQDEVARAVVQKLTRRTAIAAASMTTNNLEAYDLYLRTRTTQLRGSSGPSTFQAMRQYEEVVRLDPTFALAWARLAEGAASLSNLSGGYDMSEATRRRAVEAADQAVRFNPNLAEAHVARATVSLLVSYDLDAAARELQAAERLQPQSADLARARAIFEAERDPAGSRLVELAARAVELDPENPNTMFLMGRRLMLKGEFARADELLRRATVVGESQNHFLYRGLNWAAWTGDLARAIEIIVACPEESRNEIFYRNLAPVYEQHGNDAAANATWEKARAVAERDNQTPGIRFAQVQILVELARHAMHAGDRARAQKLFDEARAMLDVLTREQPENFNFWQQRVRSHLAEGSVELARSGLEASSRIARSRFQTDSVALMKAEILTAAGAPDEAVEVLRDMQARGFAFGYTLRTSLGFKPLRSLPAFQQLARDAEARADAVPRPKR